MYQNLPVLFFSVLFLDQPSIEEYFRLQSADEIIEMEKLYKFPIPNVTDNQNDSYIREALKATEKIIKR